MTVPLDPVGVSAAAKAVYGALPIALKDLVSRADAEASTGMPHGDGVPDRWIAEAAVRAYLAVAGSPADERLREARDRWRERARDLEAQLHRANDELVQIADYSPSEVANAIDSTRAAIKGLQKHDGGLWELAFAAGRGAERERIVAALKADYRANVADGADGIYTDGLHDAWRLTVRRAKRDDLIKPVSGSSEPRKETT